MRSSFTQIVTTMPANITQLHPQYRPVMDMYKINDLYGLCFIWRKCKPNQRVFFVNSELWKTFLKLRMSTQTGQGGYKFFVRSNEAVYNDDIHASSLAAK